MLLCSILIMGEMLEKKIEITNNPEDANHAQEEEPRKFPKLVGFFPVISRRNKLRRCFHFSVRGIRFFVSLKNLEGRGRIFSVDLTTPPTIGSDSFFSTKLKFYGKSVHISDQLIWYLLMMKQRFCLENSN